MTQTKSATHRPSNVKGKANHAGATKLKLLQFLRRFSLLYFVKGGFALLTGSKTLDKLLNVLFNKCNALFALSLAGMSSSYSIIKEYLTGKTEYAKAIAGSISAFWLLLDPDQTRTSTISSILFVRAIHFAINSLVYKTPGPMISTTPKLKVRNTSSRICNQIIKIIDNYGAYLIWIYISFHINITLFLKKSYLPKSLYKSLFNVAAHPERYGKNYQHILQGIADLSIYLSFQPANHHLNLVPKIKTTKAFILGCNDDIMKGIKELAGRLPDIHHGF